MPVATRAGRAALIGLAALTLGAGLTGHPLLALCALIAGALLLWTYGSLALLLFELKRRRLEFTWVVSEGPDPCAGGHLDVELRFRNRSPFTWRPVRVEPVVPSAIAVESADVDLPRRSDIRVPLRLDLLRAGRWVAHGATLYFEDAGGLFRVAPYCGRPLHLRVRPAVDALTAVRPSRAVAEGGARARRQRGLGTDLREIREHRHGDPFRRIAWKASARRGELMVREFEAEVRVPVVLAVDVGPSMRLGVPGHAPLDLAMRAASGFAQAALAEGDPVGLVTFSSRRLAFVPPRLDAGQLRRIEDALLDAIVEIPLGDVEDGPLGLLRVAARYLARESGLRVRHDLGGPGDDVLVLSAVDRIIGRLRRSGKLTGPPLSEQDRLRAFVRIHGLEPPLAPRDAWSARDRGLIEAARAVTTDGRSGRRLLLVISDLAAVREPATVARALARLRARVRAAVVAPRAAPNEGSGKKALAPEAVLRELALAQERRAAVSVLARAGVPVLVAEPGEDLRVLLAKAASYRESGRRAG